MSEKLDVLRLTFYTAPLTCIVLLPFYQQLESERFEQYRAEHSQNYMGELVKSCIRQL